MMAEPELVVQMHLAPVGGLAKEGELGGKTRGMSRAIWGISSPDLKGQIGVVRFKVRNGSREIGSGPQF